MLIVSRLFCIFGFYILKIIVEMLYKHKKRIFKNEAEQKSRFVQKWLEKGVYKTGFRGVYYWKTECIWLEEVMYIIGRMSAYGWRWTGWRSIYDWKKESILLEEGVCMNVIRSVYDSKKECISLEEGLYVTGRRNVYDWKK